MADVDELVWCAFDYVSHGNGTFIIDPADFPEDGPLEDDFSPES